MWCWIKTLPLRRWARVVVTLTRCYPKVACYHWHLYRQANNTRDDRSSIISTPPLYNTKGDTVLVPEKHFNSRHMHTSVVSTQQFPLMWWKASGSIPDPQKLHKQITFLLMLHLHLTPECSSSHENISHKPRIFEDRLYFSTPKQASNMTESAAAHRCSSIAFKKYM